MLKHERYCPRKIPSSHLNSIYILCKKKKMEIPVFKIFFSSSGRGIYVMMGFITVDITSFLVSKLANSTS